MTINQPNQREDVMRAEEKRRLIREISEITGDQPMTRYQLATMLSRRLLKSNIVSILKIYCTWLRQKLRAKGKLDEGYDVVGIVIIVDRILDAIHYTSFVQLKNYKRVDQTISSSKGKDVYYQVSTYRPI